MRPVKEVVAVVNVQQGASLTPFIPPAESLEKLLSASNFQLPDTSGSGAGTSAAAQASFMKVSMHTQEPSANAVVQIIADNPDFLQHAISTDPRMQHLMERNPQLRHALSDPSTMRDILSMATNRTAYTEMMRGHDRQLSNLENIPQGFQQLQQLYRDMDSTLGDTKALRSGSQTKGSGSWQPKKELVRKPMPNPWKKQPAASGMTEHAASAMPAPSAAIDGSTAMSASSPLLPPEQRFAAQLASMLDMGFSDREANMRALMACKGSMSMAIEWLLAHPSNSSTSSGAAKKSDNGNATTAGSKSETDTAPSDDKNVQARGSETGREEEK